MENKLDENTSLKIIQACSALFALKKTHPMHTNKNVIPIMGRSRILTSSDNFILPVL